MLYSDKHTQEEQHSIWGQFINWIADENIRKFYRLAILSQHGLRNRVMVYLLMQARRRASRKFQIPFSREELAYFLCVNRSSLSHELSHMEQESCIRFKKQFCVIRYFSWLVLFVIMRDIIQLQD